MNTEKSSDAVRRARKELQAKVRDDWDEVLDAALPDHSVAAVRGTKASGDSPAASAPTDDSSRFPFRRRRATKSKAAAEPQLATIGGEALEWRERTYASSDPSSDEGEPGVDGSKSMSFARRKGSPAGEGREGVNATDQDVPADASLTPVERRKLARKLRRRKRLEAEMDENPGLRYWEQRRDVWCHAQSASPTPPPGQTRSHPPGSYKPSPERATSSSASTSTFTYHSSSSLSSNSSATPQLQAERDAKTQQVDAADQSERTDQLNSENQQQEPTPTRLLPVAPPILSPTDPTRQNITPSTYPSIYNKLVTQSLAPSVPINLSHVVPALVQGWKDNDEWPPRSTVGSTTTVTSMGGAMSAFVDAAGSNSTTGGRLRLSRSRNANGGSGGSLRKLRIVDHGGGEASKAKGKGKDQQGQRRVLGHAIVRADALPGNSSTLVEEGEDEEDAGQEVDDKASNAGSGKRRSLMRWQTDQQGSGTGTSTPDTNGTGTPTSPLRSRMQAMRAKMGEALR